MKCPFKSLKGVVISTKTHTGIPQDQSSKDWSEIRHAPNINEEQQALMKGMVYSANLIKEHAI